jgi:DNA-directed RNA polymerase subunit M/transcription elongation factor TFIIS
MMGYAYLAKCKKCGHKFMVHVGPSFTALMLHCDKCGREKRVSLMKIDNFIEKHKEEGKKLSYEEIVEKIAGKCKCGGHFKIDAPPRCPKCGSTDLEDTGEVNMLYD